MDKVFHCVSGLPRSGSTLLCNILSQNPRFYATQTSGLAEVITNVKNQWDAIVEHKAHPLPVAKLNVLKGILNSYYKDIEKPVIFDKSRSWPSHIEMLETILDRKAKLLCCVRPVPDVLASLEKINRETSKTKQPPGERGKYVQFQSQEGRCDYWLQGDGMLGMSLSKMRDAIHRGFRDRMLFIDYGDLTYRPKKIMQNIYDFLEEPYYEHNFNHVEQVTVEDDDFHGYVGLHKIKPKVQPQTSDAATVLGTSLARKYRSLSL